MFEVSTYATAYAAAQTGGFVRIAAAVIALEAVEDPLRNPEGLTAAEVIKAAVSATMAAHPGNLDGNVKAANKRGESTIRKDFSDARLLQRRWAAFPKVYGNAMATNDPLSTLTAALTAAFGTVAAIGGLSRVPGERAVKSETDKIIDAIRRNLGKVDLEAVKAAIGELADMSAELVEMEAKAAESAAAIMTKACQDGRESVLDRLTKAA